VNAGAVVAGPRPLKVAGNLNYDENEKQLDILSGQMWGNKGNEGGRGNVYGKGRVFTKTTLKEILSGLNVKPDFSCDRNDSINLLYIHKKSADADIYFVVNQENRAVDRECTFRIAERVPEIWDPEYGTVTLPADYRVSEGTTTVRLKFEPKEALFFIFEKKKEDGLQARKDPTEKYVLKDCTGTLEFEGLPDKKAIPVTGFSSWTLLEDPDIRYYTGKATYDLNFSVPSGLLSKNPVYISLDSVMVAYDITLNGKLLGSSVFPGYRFDVTGMLEEKDNKLGIHVANTWRNRIIGDFTQYGKLKNCWTTSPVNNLPGKDKPLQKSGIFGPVSLYY
jgi:hypothetical protein